MSTPAFATPVPGDLTRDRLRVEHEVRSLNSEEEGTAFSRLPNGVYGFTYAPATETPLSARHAYHSFEVHKLPDGSGRLLVCCTCEDAARIAAGEAVEVLVEVLIGVKVSQAQREVRAVEVRHSISKR